jgi:hypothetical protein
MKTQDAIQTFGSIKEIAKALGLSVQAIYAWGEDVPPLRAYQLREIIEQRANITADDKLAA